MAFDIVIQKGFFVVNDTSAIEHIRAPRELTIFTVDNSVYQFYWKVPVQDGNRQDFIMGIDPKEFAFADLGSVIEDGVTIPIANEAALTIYLSGVISFFFNPNPVLTLDFLLEVNKGNVEGHSMLGVVSSNAAVGTSFTDIWSGGGDMVYPTVGETLEVVSDDANDTIAGSGAQKVSIITLDSSGDPQVSVVDMNGLTPVTVAGGAIHFNTNRFVVSQSGTVRGRNAGNITLRVVSAGATRAVIPFNASKGLEGSSFNSHFTVQNGTTAFWIQSTIFPPKGEDINVRSMFQLGGAGQFFVGGVSSSYQTGIVYPFKTGLGLPEGSNFLMQAQSTNAGSFVTIVTEFLIVENAFVLTASVMSANNFEI